MCKLSRDSVSGTAAALTSAEVQRLAFPLETKTVRLLLAVSGGADSMALMHLAARRVLLSGCRQPLVATVDHGLRPRSADEARFVAAEAAKLGLRHVTLHWTGEKPSTGIQAAAREARYRLLADLCLREACHAVVTAHTEDDQAETFLMRLARGSGVEGLAGMRPVAELFGARVIRPLLAIPRSRLVATLVSGGHCWIEDPSNDDPCFERVRIRQALKGLEQVGVTAEAIARSARRLSLARDAVAHEARRVIDDAHLVRVDRLGYVVLSKSMWIGESATSAAIRLRVLALSIEAVGGHANPLSFSALEDLDRGIELALATSSPFATTLGLAKIRLRPRDVLVTREEGRDPPAPVAAVPGERLVWDNRFELTIGDECPPALVIRALGVAGLKVLRQQELVPAGVPAEVLHTLPAVWAGEQLIAVPGLADVVRTADSTGHPRLWTLSFRGINLDPPE